MANDIREIVDRVSYRPLAAAVAATPGALDIQNINGTLKKVDDQASATDIGGGGGSSGGWDNQMLAFAQTLFPTNKMTTAFYNDWTDGAAVNGARGWKIAQTTGSPTTPGLTATIKSGVLVGDTTAVANSGQQIYPNDMALAPLVLNIKTDVPWFVAARCALVGTVTANMQLRAIEMRGLGGTPGGSGAVMLGIDGGDSLVDFAVRISKVSSTHKALTGKTIVQSMTDFAISFDGVTITYYQGDIMTGTLVSLGTDTDLTNMPTDIGGCTFSFFNNGTAASMKIQNDKLYAAIAL